MESLDYTAVCALLKRMGFTRKHGEAQPDSQYGPRGEYSVWKSADVLALVVNEEGHYYGNNCVMLECAECFDKWSGSPMVARLPVAAGIIEQAIAFLSSSEGVRYSKTFAYLDAVRADVPFEERYPK